MKEKFRPYEPGQAYLFPPSPKDWLPEGHLAYFMSETVDELDLRDLSEAYASDERGEKAYHPEMMLKVLRCRAKSRGREEGVRQASGSRCFKAQAQVR